MNDTKRWMTVGEAMISLGYDSEESVRRLVRDELLRATRGRPNGRMAIDGNVLVEYCSRLDAGEKPIPGWWREWSPGEVA